MLRPLATPMEPAQSRLAGVLTRLTGTPGEQLVMTTLAVRQTGGVRAVVICHLADGAREVLELHEAAEMARVLRDGTDAADPRWPVWADSLDDAAEAAARQASAILLAVRAPDGVGFAREFRGAR